MLDFGNLPDSTNSDVQVFPGFASVAQGDWKMWHKPRGVSMLFAFMLGAGGSGGNGAVGATSTAGGGGGGGSGGGGSLLIPAVLLPDVLYLCVGKGRIAGNGFQSYVCIAPNATTANIVLTCGVGNAASNAVAGAGGAGGGGGGAMVIANMPLTVMGLFQSWVGSNGTAGGNAVAGTAFTVTAGGTPSSPGTGGGGLPAANNAGTAGGAINGAGYITGLLGGTGGAVTPTSGSAGNDGVRPYKNLQWTLGGTGGGSGGVAAGGASGGAGGLGGNGAYGGGGGGGGGGFTGSATATGGEGGDGLVIICAW